MNRVAFGVVSVAAGLVVAAGARAAEPAGEKWIPLFNGKNLDGWTAKVKGYPLGENPGQVFRVEDGLLRVTYRDVDDFEDRYGHLFYQNPYFHYRLRAEYRFVGEQVRGGPGWAFRNNGLMVHGQAPETMAIDQSFPDSIEVQLLGGNGSEERPTGNVCTPGTHIVITGELTKTHCLSSKSKTYHGDQWVTIEVEVHGHGEIIHRVNGEEVLRYEKPQLDNGTPLESGTISIQAESHDTDFRKIEILPLAAPAS